MPSFAMYVRMSSQNAHLPGAMIRPWTGAALLAGQAWFDRIVDRLLQLLELGDLVVDARAGRFSANRTIRSSMKRWGWSRFGWDIRVERPGGSIVYDIMQAMALPLATGAPRSSNIDDLQ